LPELDCNTLNFKKNEKKNECEKLRDTGKNKSKRKKVYHRKGDKKRPDKKTATVALSRLQKTEKQKLKPERQKKTPPKATTVLSGIAEKSQTEEQKFP
jgi:hypothetical protein